MGSEHADACGTKEAIIGALEAHMPPVFAGCLQQDSAVA